MTLLALDASTTKIGWACFTQGQAPDFGLLDLPKGVGKAHVRFLRPARAWLTETIREHSIKTVIYEAPWLGNDPGFARAVGALCGTIDLLCDDLGVDCSETTPSSWRSKVLGVTKAPKDIKGDSARRQWLKRRAIEYCRQRGWMVTNDDEAEACCIGVYELSLHDNRVDFGNLPLAGGRV